VVKPRKSTLSGKLPRMSTQSPRVPTDKAARKRPKKPARASQTAAAPATAPARRPRKPTALSPRQRLFLRGLGHHLQPVVYIGKEGISDGVVGALEAALDQHELLKLRLSENAPGERQELATTLAERSNAALVQVMGRTLLLYRRRPDEPRAARPHIQLPA
jgi:RNA-binding protein